MKTIMNKLKKTISLVGNSKTGKTSFIDRIVYGTFRNNYISTIGFNLNNININIENNKYNIHFIDTSGNKKIYDFSRTNIFKDIDAIIYMYDVTDKNSFECIQEWIEYTKGMVKDKNNCSMFIIGSKIDLEEKREVKEEEGRNLAKQNGMNFLELSSTTKESVNKSMLFIIKKMLNLPDDFSSEILMGKNSENINKKETKEKEDSCCCFG